MNRCALEMQSTAITRHVRAWPSGARVLRCSPDVALSNLRWHSLKSARSCSGRTMAFNKSQLCTSTCHRSDTAAPCDLPLGRRGKRDLHCVAAATGDGLGTSTPSQQQRGTLNPSCIITLQPPHPDTSSLKQQKYTLQWRVEVHHQQFFFCNGQPTRSAVKGAGSVLLCRAYNMSTFLILHRVHRGAAKPGGSSSSGNGVFALLLVNIGVFALQKVLQQSWVPMLYLNHAHPQWWQFITNRSVRTAGILKPSLPISSGMLKLSVTLLDSI